MTQYPDEVIDGRPYFDSWQWQVAWPGTSLSRVGRFAAFTDAERAAMQAHGPIERLEAILVDTRHNREWPAFGPAYDPDEVDVAEDESPYRWTLAAYGLYHHYCPCHREGSIKGEGPDDCDDECTDGRWLVKSVTHPALPGVVLYAERLVK